MNGQVTLTHHEARRLIVERLLRAGLEINFTAKEWGDDLILLPVDGDILGLARDLNSVHVETTPNLVNTALYVKALA